MRAIVLPRPITSPEPGGLSISSLWNNITSRRYSIRQLAFVALASIVLLLFFALTPSSDDPFKAIPWSPRNFSYPSSKIPPKVWEQRAERVKQAFIHAYSGYEQHASSHDELRPLSNSTSDTWVVLGVASPHDSQPLYRFNGWGATMYDSLDTMLLMGLYDEFARTLPVIQNANFSMIRVGHVA